MGLDVVGGAGTGGLAEELGGTLAAGRTLAYGNAAAQEELLTTDGRAVAFGNALAHEELLATGELSDTGLPEAAGEAAAGGSGGGGGGGVG